MIERVHERAPQEPKVEAPEPATPAPEGGLLDIQRKAGNQSALAMVQRKGDLPGSLKSGIENLSGYSMDDVKVHYNSERPTQLNAHAYAQGSDIYVAPGQEKHLAHEAWHVVQQRQGVQLGESEGAESEGDEAGSQATMVVGDAESAESESSE